MVPTSMRSGSAWPCWRKYVSSRSTIALAWSNSETSEIIGNMIFSARPPPARSSARIWPRNTPGCARPSRYAPPAERGIFLNPGLHKGHSPAAADIEFSDGNGLDAGGVQHGAIELELV